MGIGKLGKDKEDYGRIGNLTRITSRIKVMGRRSVKRRLKGIYFCVREDPDEEEQKDEKNYEEGKSSL